METIGRGGDTALHMSRSNCILLMFTGPERDIA